MLNVIGKGQKEEGPKECEQKIVERVEKGLGEELGELEAERSDINDEDMLKSVMNRQIPLSQYLYFFSFSFLLIM